MVDCGTLRKDTCAVTADPTNVPTVGWAATGSATGSCNTSNWASPALTDSARQLSSSRSTAARIGAAPAADPAHDDNVDGAYTAAERTMSPELMAAAELRFSETIAPATTQPSAAARRNPLVAERRECEW